MLAESVQVVLFDAVGTVIYPQPSIADAYVNIGSRFIEDLDPDEVLRRFKLVFSRVFSAENAQSPVTESSTVESWRQVVEGTFPEFEDTEGALFQQLWDHFADSRSWEVYDDVAECFTRIRSQGIQIGIASNFDSRLERIVNLDPVLSQAEYVFHSAQLGWNKPAVGFCDGIGKRLGLQPNQIVLVGDRLDNDIQPALAAGWQGIWIDREEIGPAAPIPKEVQRIVTLNELS